MSSIRGSVTTRHALVALLVTSILLVEMPLIGAEPRSVSFTLEIPATENTPPTIEVPDAFVARITSHNFTITSWDPDAEDIVQYIWDWGDGSPRDVTSTKFAAHTYYLFKVYTLTVFADDQTGLPGHNVSDWGWVIVEQKPPSRPVIVQFGMNISSPVTGQEVMFTGTAVDADGDICSMRFDFGDGTEATVMQTAPNTMVSANHTYSVPGLKAACLYAFDGWVETVSDALSFIVWDASNAFTLNLVTGWNLASIPLVGYGYNASTLGLNAGDTVSLYNSTTRTYKSHIVGFPVNDFAIAPGTGFWINVPSGTRMLTLYGYVPNTTQSIIVIVPYGGGWALIGFLGLKTWHAHDIPGLCNVTITTVAKYNPVTKSYTSWLPVIPNINDFLIEPGHAYWILIPGSGTLTYDP
ncbi:MAG: PKD domain-containing protein [Thermoplasmatota archaeon]|nr:PKD domain-containing protein [Candidatus Thermoplasmatota archaeon]MBU1914386.1 PKD domain-containing protein [Candidatus Thermoplasmatota archaeon]